MMNAAIKFRKNVIRKHEFASLNFMGIRDIRHIAENRMFIVIDENDKPVYMIPEDSIAYISMEHIED